MEWPLPILIYESGTSALYTLVLDYSFAIHKTVDTLTGTLVHAATHIVDCSGLERKAWRPKPLNEFTHTTLGAE